jgi:hypothetical protein
MVVNLARESNEVRGFSIVIKQFIVQSDPVSPWRSSQRCHGSNPGMVEPWTLNRRLPFRSPNLTPKRLEQKPTFIKKNNTSIAFEALFLTAANLRGSTERWHRLAARELVAWVAVGSNPVGEAGVECNWDGTSPKTAAQPCPALVDLSIRQARIPSIAFRTSAIPSECRIALQTTLESGPDAVWMTGLLRFAKHLSSDSQKKHYSQYSQPLPLMYSPARTSGLRFFDGFRELGDCLLVSCTHSTDSPFSFH